MSDKSELARLVAGSYGPAAFFAGHPSDEERAFDLLVYARRNGIGWAQLRGEFEAFLGRRMTSPDGDGAQQIAKIETYYRPWLLD